MARAGESVARRAGAIPPPFFIYAIVFCYRLALQFRKKVVRVVFPLSYNPCHAAPIGGEANTKENCNAH